MPFLKLKENQIEMSDIERDAPSLVIIFLILILVVGAGFVGYSLGERHQIEKEKNSENAFRNLNHWISA